MSTPESQGVDEELDLPKEIDEKKKEIYTYEAPWPTYALGWSRCTLDDSKLFRFAVSSFQEEYCNKIEIVRLNREEKSSGFFDKLASFDHPYPATKLMWSPPGEKMNLSADLIAITGDYLRLWSVSDQHAVEMKCLLNNNRHTAQKEYCAPITSFDWNETDPSVIGTCSIDTTCTIWDVEVYDFAFTQGKDVFATVGADGSLRMFDLRSLEHSTILYESQDLVPLVRVAWNKLDTNLLATITSCAKNIAIIDIRFPAAPVAELNGHVGSINGITWAPHSAHHLCSVADDMQALIWDVGVATDTARVIEDPILAYVAPAEINQVNWSAQHQEWVSIAYDHCVQVLRV